LIGRPEVRDRLEVIDAAPVEQSGDIGRPLSRVDRELGHAIRDDGNRFLCVAARPAKRSPDWAPRAMDPVELHACSLQILGEGIDRGRLIAP
jgi:hypothetical protein